MASNRSDVVYGDMVLVPEKIPYTGKGVEALLAFLRKVLEENKYTQKIVVEVQKPIYIEKLVPKDEAPETVSLTWLESARNKQMQEYEGTEEKLAPQEQLLDMFHDVNVEGYEICHVITGNLKKFFKWAKGQTHSGREHRLYGVPVSQADIPEDVIILCGAQSRDAGPDDLEFSLKAVLT
jgi:hypothetical protein